MQPFLLDTCAAIWIAESQKISTEASRALEQAFDERVRVLVSPMTAWEVGMLAARGRISLQIKPQLWFQRLIDDLNFDLAEMPPQILIASCELPGKPPRDPVDRILAATAREFGYQLVTRDRPLLVYGEQGHIQTLAC